jgi:hypothetical protein
VSIKNGMPAFWRARKVAKASISSFVSLVGYESIFDRAQALALMFWGIANWKVSYKLTEIILTERDYSLYLQIFLFFNFFGSFTRRRATKVALHYIIAVNIIGRKLSRLRSHHNRDLTEKEIQESVVTFKSDPQKEKISKAIDQRMEVLLKIDYKADDRDQQVMKVADEVITEVITFPDASFFQKERLRMLRSL